MMLSAAAIDADRRAHSHPNLIRLCPWDYDDTVIDGDCKWHGRIGQEPDKPTPPCLGPSWLEVGGSITCR